MSPKVYLVLPCETCGKNYNAAGPIDRLVCCGRPMRYQPMGPLAGDHRAVMDAACKVAGDGRRVVRTENTPPNVIEGEA